jgi:UPF0755 protein
MRRAMRAMLAVVLVAAALGGILGWVGWQEVRAPGPLVTDTQVVVPRGGTAAIADTLAERGVISDARLFTAVAVLTRQEGPLRAAEFNFPARASMRQVLTVLREARPVQRFITIAEGLTARQITALIDGIEGLTGETPAIAEGALLPETFAFTLGDTRASIVRRAGAAMEQALAAIWAARADGLPISTPREAVILASIIERETGMADERGLVGGVFINRLRRGMMLQSDPTVAYGAGEGMPLDRALTRADLNKDHPYNTYRIRGLPPGPIASPGRDSLRAATQPETTEYIFFVADGTGGHAFARTLAEHNRNVARWRALNR